MQTLYTAHATTSAGRDGHTTTDDGKIDLELSAPGSDGDGTNPEQLFACGYSACFGSALKSVAKSRDVSFDDITIKADVDLLKDEETGYNIAVHLDATIEGVDANTAKELVHKAHEVCPYSKATRGNIEVKLSVSGEALQVPPVAA